MFSVTSDSFTGNVKDEPFDESTKMPRVLVEKLDMDAIKCLTRIEYKNETIKNSDEPGDVSERKLRKRKISSEDSELQLRKRIISSEDSEESEDSEFQIESFDEVDDDSDYKVEPIARRKKYVKSTKKDNKKTKSSKNKEVGMSAYEKMVEQKKQESLAFLQSLKIDEVKSSLSEVVNAFKKKSPPRPHKKIKKEYLILRPKSKRSTKLAIDYTEEALFERGVVGSTEEIKVDPIQRIPSRISFRDALKSKKMYVEFRKDVKEALEPKEQPILYDNSVIQKLPLKLSNNAEVTPEKTTCLAWYPSAHHMIIAAGSKLGNIGIWNVYSNPDSHVFKVHNEGTTHVQFNPFNPVELFSSSYEGTLRRGDMVQSMFTEVFSVNRDTFCSYFDFITSTTYLVGLSNGEVALVDGTTRKNNGVIKHFCHEDSVRIVNMHPVNKNVFVTAGSKGSVRLWDLRMLRKEPIADIIHHKKAVSSAFFSPVTGNSLLTKSKDDTICIFNSRNLTQVINPIRSFRLKNGSLGRYFRAEWLPNSDDIFAVSNVQHSIKRIQLYDKRSKIFHLLLQSELNENSMICNTFHPFVPSIACYTESIKKVTVFA